MVTLLKCVLESAEHQHLHAHDLFQIRKESFRRQSIVSEGCEKVHAYATEKALGEMTLDLENTHLPISMSPLFLLSEWVGEQHQEFAFVSADPKLACLMPHLVQWYRGWFEGQAAVAQQVEVNTRGSCSFFCVLHGQELT